MRRQKQQRRQAEAKKKADAALEKEIRKKRRSYKRRSRGSRRRRKKAIFIANTWYENGLKAIHILPSWRVKVFPSGEVVVPKTKEELDAMASELVRAGQDCQR